MNAPPLSDWRAATIRGHGFLSDGQTAAMVYEDATIDWLCMPNFDSEACLVALLGTGENGGWWLHPSSEVTQRTRRYRDDTLILETVFATDDGEVAVIDFMPAPRGEAPDLVRIVEGRRGTVEMTSRLALRFDYGRTHPEVEAREHDSALIAVAGPNAIALRASVPIEQDERALNCRFSVSEGERETLVLTWFASCDPVPAPVDVDAALAETDSYWSDWAAQTRFSGPNKTMVQRSLLSLKGLIDTRTGGMVAAATSSLPERPGGTRNWDYRYCWLRDATFTLIGLMHTGHGDEARDWIAWLRRAVAGAPIDVQPFYGIDGRRHLMEWEADWLCGFGNAQPVRFGNGAVGQCQLDVYGEVIDALSIAANAGLCEPQPEIIAQLAHKLEGIWRQADAGIWESRGEPQHHVYSKAMCWVAFDRAAAMFAEARPAEARRWRNLAEEVRSEVLERGYDADRRAFTRSYEEKALDGAVLRLPLCGFIAADDPRMADTVRAIESELMCEGLVRRYASDQTDDGVGGTEGTFLAVGCWLAEVYAMQGRMDDARALFERIAASANDLGLLSEEIWPEDGRALGNVPQALSHVALVNAALTIAANGKAARLSS